MGAMEDVKEEGLERQTIDLECQARLFEQLQPTLGKHNRGGQHMTGRCNAQEQLPSLKVGT